MASSFTWFVVIGGLAAAAGCIEPEDPVTDTETVDQSIDFPEVGGSYASRFQLDRAFDLVNCPATRIAPRWLLTSAVCSDKQTPGKTVFAYGYLSTGEPGPSTTAIVASTIESSYADIGLVELVDDDWWATDATLAWRYPGEDVSGQFVGYAGQTQTGTLWQVTDETDSEDDSYGDFYTEDRIVDDWDDGGPFYHQNRIIGVATEYGSAGLGATFTSVPMNLGWVLNQIEYRWSGGMRISQAYTGPTVGAPFTLAAWDPSQTETVCQYACEHTSACQAYNYRTDTKSCALVQTVTGVVAQPNTQAALRHAAPRGAAADVAGFSSAWGSDGARVDHRGLDGTIHRHFLWPGGSWQGFSGITTAPLSSRVAQFGVTGTGFMTVFRSGNTLRMLGGDFPGTLPLAPSTTPAGAPTAYIRADGFKAVVYRTTGNRLIELMRRGTTWIATDLLAEAGAPLTVVSDPAAYVRSDGYSAVVFRASDNRIYELYKGIPGTSWAYGSPHPAAAPAAAGNPRPYVHVDGTNAIVYRSDTNRIIELRLSGGWQFEDITGAGAAAAGDPWPYVRTDAVESVVYRSTSNHIWELTHASTWVAWNLSVQWAGGATAASDPSAYVRRDGFNAVVFKMLPNDIGELAIQIGSVGWHWGLIYD